uniref:Uncharacterized protein n=1 Tax=Prymnesium polylepis TaxID=72548 RepID=A0A7S4IDH3_9EUKA|mmetsp:Transcript_30016/g.73899  ORF Transcript_30016/g.73899 Transcript_30016/m.73899 type:complete len:500 (+) Transcript_30016:799-2298(+)
MGEDLMPSSMSTRCVDAKVEHVGEVSSSGGGAAPKRRRLHAMDGSCGEDAGGDSGGIKGGGGEGGSGDSGGGDCGVGGKRGHGEEGGSATYIDPPHTMTEYACPKRAAFVANLTLDDYKPIAAVSRQRQCKSDLKGSHRRVVEWAMKHAESDLSNGHEFSYRHGPGKDFGRMASNSMMGIPRDIRGFVCIDEDTKVPILTDLDMDNCHCVILEWLCKKHGIACEELSNYKSHRQQHKDALMESTGRSKDDVKSMFLAAVNSQNEMAWCQTNLTPFFIAFDKRCSAIQLAIMQLVEYRYLLPHAERAANENLEEKKAERRRDRKTINGLTANVAGSFVNLVLCTWENRFLGLACKTAIGMGLKPSVNNFDGMMIRGNHYPAPNNAYAPESTVRDDVICPALEQALLDAFGIAMGWSMKRHSSPLVYSEDGLRLPYVKHAQPWLERICRVGYLWRLSVVILPCAHTRRLGCIQTQKSARFETMGRHCIITCGNPCCVRTGT